MDEFTVSDVLLGLVALINFLPVFGVISRRRLEGLYGVELPTHDLTLLMRHRALLFGILGSVIAYGIYCEAARLLTYIVAGIAMLGFIVLAYKGGKPNGNLVRVVRVDLVGLLLLGLAAVLDLSA